VVIIRLERLHLLRLVHVLVLDLVHVVHGSEGLVEAESQVSESPR
jgi:hypothetical protein